MTFGGPHWIALALLFAACSSTSTPSGSDAGSDVRVFDAAHLCGNANYQLAMLLHPPGTGPQSCAIVVRVLQRTGRPIAFQSICGRDAPTAMTDAQALALAEGAMVPNVSSWQPVSPSMPDDDFVFSGSGGDFGGVVVVHPRLGRTVFVASTVWAGRGDILSPTTWNPPGLLADDCGTGTTIPRVRGYQLGVASDRKAATVTQVTEAVAHTALLDAIVREGTIESGVVLGYTRSTGGLVDEAPEWIVVVNAAWAR